MLIHLLQNSLFFIKALLTHEDKPSFLPTTLQQLNHLKLDVQLTKDELPGIACLLRSSPELQSLTIHLCRQAYIDKDLMEPTENGIRGLSDWSEERFWDHHEQPFYSLKCNLKKVAVQNFRGEENEIMFLAFLLRNSLFLKKVVIFVQPIGFTGSGEAYVEYCRKAGRASKKNIENIRKLMQSPRSQHTEILFSGSPSACFK